MSDLFCKIVSVISNTRRKELEEIARSKKLPLSRLIAIAIEREFERDEPFDYNMSLPEDDFVDHAYIDEAGKILDYMKQNSGMAQDLMVIMRHDMRVRDKDVFLAALRECVIKEFLVPYTPKQNDRSLFKHDEETVFYRVPGTERKMAKKIRREATQYETYQKLKKKFKEK